MNARAVIGLVLPATLVGAIWLWRPAAPLPTDNQAIDSTPLVGFPPDPSRWYRPSSAPSPRVMRDRWDWLDSGAVVPSWYPRREFEEAPDLYRLALSVVGEAAAGSAVHAYLLYLALDECHSFLRQDARSIHPLYERMLGAGSALNPHEQAQWAEQFNRCVGFAVYDWSSLGDSLGPGRPEVSVEFAGAWFLRAVQAGHPPALLESAFRPGHTAASERRRRIARALESDDPEVYWLLFLQIHERDHPPAQARALPWLRLACEAGLDCRFHAPWFQQRFCMLEPCRPAASALAWFWQGLPAQQREEAQAGFDQMLRDLEQGRFDRLSLPVLPAGREALPGP